MKKLISLFISLAFAGSSFAQMSGYSSSQSDGTTLGANETLTADGIALGNAVKLRGYVDFVASFAGVDGDGDLSGIDGDSRFTTSGDLDLLIDLSPITSEVHLNVGSAGVGLEQMFARYSFNSDFGISFGRQLTSLGYESDESPELFAVTNGYFADGLRSHPALVKYLNDIVRVENLKADAANAAAGLSLTPDHPNYIHQQTVSDVLPKLRRNYVDGVKLNYNNGMFGLVFGLHDGYWRKDDFNDNSIAIDLAASVMFFPGLEARLGYAHQELDDDEIGHFNTWLEWNPGDLTLAFEFDNFDLGGNSDLWDIMLLANYQFTDFFAATFRYTHEDGENINILNNYESDRITLALLFAITQNFALNIEYSHTEIDTNYGDGDTDEFYVEGLVSF
jgi:hypothetical protein